jgi:hypothetical protein
MNRKPANKKTSPADRQTARRAMLKGAAALLGGGAVGAVLSVAAAQTPAKSPAAWARTAESIVAAKGVAVVQTEAGAVAGYIHNG